MPVWAVQLMIGLALSVASTLMQQASNSTKKEQYNGFRGSAQTGGVVPKSFIIGTFGTPGKSEYENTYGEVNDVPNAYYVGVFSLGDIPITEHEKTFVNLYDVGHPTTGQVSKGFPYPQYVDGGKNHLWRHIRDGTQTTASSYLV